MLLMLKGIEDDPNAAQACTQTRKNKTQQNKTIWVNFNNKQYPA